MRILILRLNLCIFPSFLAIFVASSAFSQTIIVPPDTQNYVRVPFGGTECQGPDRLIAQTQWIQATQPDAVIWVGDLFSQPDQVPGETEAICFDGAFSLIDTSIPNVLNVGNHDDCSSEQPCITYSSTELFNQTFPFTRFENQPWYGGHFGTNNDHHFALFSAKGIDFVVVSLGWQTNPAVYAWAKNVFESHPTRFGIVTQHSIIFAQKEHGYTLEGVDTFNALKDCENVKIMFCGHQLDRHPDGSLDRTSGKAERVQTEIIGGRSIHIILSNYQLYPAFNGWGQGYLRINEFSHGGLRLNVSTYSPWLDQSLVGPSSQFSLNFGVPGDVNTDGVINVRDLLDLLTNWGGEGLTDIDGSGSTSTLDLLTLLGNWG